MNEVVCVRYRRGTVTRPPNRSRCARGQRCIYLEQGAPPNNVLVDLGLPLTTTGSGGMPVGKQRKIISQAAVTGYTRIERATHSSRHLCETVIGQGNNCTEVHVHPSHPSRRTTHHIPCRMRQCGVRRHIPRHRRQLPLCQVCTGGSRMRYTVQA